MTNLRSIAPSESSLVTGLEKEIESLQTERREVENWLNQAESWAAHMGQWKATVGMPPQVTYSLAGKKHLVLFYLIVSQFKNPDDKENWRFPVELHLEDEAAMIAVTSNNGSTSSKYMLWPDMACLVLTTSWFVCLSLVLKEREWPCRGPFGARWRNSTPFTVNWSLRVPGSSLPNCPLSQESHFLASSTTGPIWNGLKINFRPSST